MNQYDIIMRTIAAIQNVSYYKNLSWSSEPPKTFWKNWFRAYWL